MAEVGILLKLVPLRDGAVPVFTNVVVANIPSVTDPVGNDNVPVVVKFLNDKSVVLPIVACLFDKSVVKFVTALSGMPVKFVPLRDGAVDDFTNVVVANIPSVTDPVGNDNV